MYVRHEEDVIVKKEEKKMRDGDEDDNVVACNANGSHEVRVNARKMV
jgi:hypothetical protein